MLLTPHHKFPSKSSKVSGLERVERMVDLLTSPAGERPDLLMVRFDQPDLAGHSAGPDSDQVHTV